MASKVIKNLTSGVPDATGAWFVFHNQSESGANKIAAPDLISFLNTGSTITITGEDYLSVSGSQITAEPVDLSNSNVTGILDASHFPSLTGDVTTSSGSVATTIANDAVTLAKIQNIATASFIGRNTAGTGDPEVLSIATAQSMLSLSGTNTGDQIITLTGDVTGSGSGSFSTTVANDAITFAKMQNIAATGVIGRKTVGTGDPELLSIADLQTILSLSGSNTGDQTITLTGDVTGSGTGSFATTIANNAVTLAKLQDISTASFLGRNTAGTGDPEILSIATSKSMLGLSGTNNGDQTITLTGDVTGSGTGSFTTTIANDAVTFAKMQNIAATGVIGRKTAGTGDPELLSISDLQSILNLSGTNTGDQTIVLTGDVTGSGTGSFSTTIADDAVTLAKIQNIATASFIGRNTGGTGDPEVLSIATAQSMLGISGTNNGDQTIVLTGDVTGSGTGSFATTIANDAVTFAKMQNITATGFIGRNTAGTGDPELLSIATAKSILGLSGTNNGDQTITLTGDVTGTGSGSFATTIANDAVTFAKMQNISTATFIGRNTASTGDPEELSVATAKTLLNLAGTNTGDQTLNGLLPSQTGNSGNFLKTDGTNTSWASTGGTSTAPYTVCDGRLTLASGTGVPTSDVSGSTIYFTPYNGNYIGLYSGSSWSVLTFSQTGITLTGLSTSGVYDVFGYNNGGALSLELSSGWTLGSGTGQSRAEPLSLQDSILVKSGSPSRRYLGTFLALNSTTTIDSARQRLLWNNYNRVHRTMNVIETTDSWTYSTASYRRANASATNQLEVVCGIVVGTMTVSVMGQSLCTGNNYRSLGIGVDSLTVSATNAIRGKDYGVNTSSIPTTHTTFLTEQTGLGYHIYVWLELGNTTTTWYGDNNAVFDQSGMTGVWEC